MYIFKGISNVYRLNDLTPMTVLDVKASKCF